MVYERCAGISISGVKLSRENGRRPEVAVGSRFICKEELSGKDELRKTVLQVEKRDTV